MDEDIPEGLFLNSVRKQTEQPVSETSRLCISSCLQVPAQFQVLL